MCIGERLRSCLRSVANGVRSSGDVRLFRIDAMRRSGLAQRFPYNRQILSWFGVGFLHLGRPAKFISTARPHMTTC